MKTGAKSYFAFLCFPCFAILPELCRSPENRPPLLWGPGRERGGGLNWDGDTSDYYTKPPKDYTKPISIGLNKAPTDNTKPQQTTQSPNRLYKAPTDYTKSLKRLEKPKRLNNYPSVTLINAVYGEGEGERERERERGK